MSSPAALASLDHPLAPPTATGIPNKKILFWAFLASDCMFFGTLISTHLVYRLHPPPGNPVPTQIFNIELLNERFYRELANWYFWALPQVEFPADLEADDEKRRVGKRE